MTGGGIGLAGEKFGDKLPAQCPPTNALDAELNDVYRLVPKAELDESSFASHFALGREKPESFKGTDCEWASCSLFGSLEAMLKIKGLRKRNKYVAKLKIPAKSGRYVASFVADKMTHVHFWRFQSFSLSTAVESVSEHGQ